MKRIQINEKNYIIKYRNADSTPLKRYAKFQKYLLYKSGIGSDMPSIANHFQTLFGLIAHDKKEESRKEAENLYYNFFAILQEVNYTDLAFCTLIYSINGVPLTDLSEENLESVIQWLSDNGMTKELCSEEVEDSRQSLLKDLQMFFPKFYTEVEDLQYYSKRKQELLVRAEKILQQIENESEEYDDEIKRILDEIAVWFIDMNKPKDFDVDSPENCVIKLESNFEQLCSMIESNGSTTKDLTLLEFYSRLEYIRKSNKPETPKNT